MLPLKGRRPPKPLQPSHVAWLKAHPDRDDDWFRARIADGFEIHHLDGDHENDDPTNLLMIEKSGHKMLHGWRVNRIVRESDAQFDRKAYQREYMKNVYRPKKARERAEREGKG